MAVFNYVETIYKILHIHLHIVYLNSNGRLFCESKHVQIPETTCMYLGILDIKFLIFKFRKIRTLPKLNEYLTEFLNQK